MFCSFLSLSLSIAILTLMTYSLFSLSWSLSLWWLSQSLSSLLPALHPFLSHLLTSLDSLSRCRHRHHCHSNTGWVGRSPLFQICEESEQLILLAVLSFRPSTTNGVLCEEKASVRCSTTALRRWSSTRSSLTQAVIRHQRKLSDFWRHSEMNSVWSSCLSTPFRRRWSWWGERKTEKEHFQRCFLNRKQVLFEGVFLNII